MTPSDRYSKAELTGWNLAYVLINSGNYAEMLTLETVFMGNYPLHPENLKRQEYRRLAIPPGSGTKLR